MSKRNTNLKDPSKVTDNASYTSNELHAMIEKEAYNNAAERGFDEGRALDDWLAAEQCVNELVNHQASI